MTLLVRALCFALFCPAFIHSAYASNQQQELVNLRNRIIKMQREIDQTNASKFRAIDALRESERAISNSNRKIAELAAQRQTTDLKLNSLHTLQQKTIVSLQAQQRILSKQLYLQYIDKNQDYFRQFFSDQEPSQVARNLRYYQYIARDRATFLVALRDNLSTLKMTTSAVHQQSAELASLSTEEIAQRYDLNNGKRARQLALRKFSQQLRQQRREVNRLQHDENHLSQLVDKLAEMLTQTKSNSMFRNENLPDNRFDGSPFAQLKGKLALPVKGMIANHFGMPRPDSTVLWKGLFLKAPSGQVVKAIAAGRVVFADWLRGFGNLLIVDHGTNYMSLYGNNETLYKQVGDLLVGGDTIASVGNSGGNEESGLYFELRHESKPFDPVLWLAAK